jgi:hypothetical protein
MNAGTALYALSDDRPRETGRSRKLIEHVNSPAARRGRPAAAVLNMLSWSL